VLCTLPAAPAAAAPPPVAEAAARGAAPAPPATLTAVPAVRAAEVAGSTGWNTHWNYYDRVYRRYDELRPLIDDLGVTLMRDGLPVNDDLLRKYRELCATGVRFVMGTDNADHLARLPGVVRELGPECVAASPATTSPTCSGACTASRRPTGRAGPATTRSRCGRSCRATRCSATSRS